MNDRTISRGFFICPIFKREKNGPKNWPTPECDESFNFTLTLCASFCFPMFYGSVIYKNVSRNFYFLLVYKFLISWRKNILNLEKYIVDKGSVLVKARLFE
jgi:hypothetical protein